VIEDTGSSSKLSLEDEWTARAAYINNYVLNPSFLPLLPPSSSFLYSPKSCYNTSYGDREWVLTAKHTSHKDNVESSLCFTCILNYFASKESCGLLNPWWCLEREDLFLFFLKKKANKAWL